MGFFLNPNFGDVALWLNTWLYSPTGMRLFAFLAGAFLINLRPPPNTFRGSPASTLTVDTAVNLGPGATPAFSPFYKAKNQPQRAGFFAFICRSNVCTFCRCRRGRGRYGRFFRPHARAVFSAERPCRNRWLYRRTWLLRPRRRGWPPDFVSP